jgi:hypothetical protein
VARRIPRSETDAVFLAPMRRAAERLSVERKSESGMANPAGWLR